jgi:hypothetical protein
VFKLLSKHGRKESHARWLIDWWFLNCITGILITMECQEICLCADRSLTEVILCIHYSYNYGNYKCSIIWVTIIIIPLFTIWYWQGFATFVPWGKHLTHAVRNESSQSAVTVPRHDTHWWANERTLCASENCPSSHPLRPAGIHSRWLKLFSGKTMFDLWTTEQFGKSPSIHSVWAFQKDERSSTVQTCPVFCCVVFALTEGLLSPD